MSCVLVIGTGTIGEALCGLLARHKDDFGIDEVLFHKNTPLETDLSKVKQLIKAGAVLCTDQDKFSGFWALGVEPEYTRLQAISRADVIIDCTPAGNKNKKEHYASFVGQGKLFIAQGSENGFGIPYAKNINDEVINNQEFVQVVSCNTHNIAVILKTLKEHSKRIVDAKFVCIRRSSDISQNEDVTPSIEVDEHKHYPWGTHHARDVARLFKTFDYNLGNEQNDSTFCSNIYSSSCKINTQYMHAIHFSVLVDGLDTEPLKALKENPSISLTKIPTAARVFSFGRDYGLFGRILTQTVVVTPTLDMRGVGPYKEVNGFCFTPQDANSLLSSVSATLQHLCGGNWTEVEKRMNCLKPYLFKEI